MTCPYAKEGHGRGAVGDAAFAFSGKICTGLGLGLRFFLFMDLRFDFRICCLAVEGFRLRQRWRKGGNTSTSLSDSSSMMDSWLIVCIEATGKVGRNLERAVPLPSTRENFRCIDLPMRLIE